MEKGKESQLFSSNNCKGPGVTAGPGGAAGGQRTPAATAVGICAILVFTTKIPIRTNKVPRYINSIKRRLLSVPPTRIPPPWKSSLTGDFANYLFFIARWIYVPPGAGGL
ncbi:hypothetical protein EVAR_46520_1 [Eumeta japonica]|uniref:Uncharacterized protein n=1 Tax=Eumeta variegata TaxID=151549 RepID=A0A4C1WVR4_EUMVA|nr:hypothetical protein EVAR_46520_1 [Eumeta japonica]